MRTRTLIPIILAGIVFIGVGHHNAAALPQRVSPLQALHNARVHIASTFAAMRYTKHQREVAFQKALSRKTLRWHHVTVLATAYLVRPVQDVPHYHCPVYNNKTASGTHVQWGSIAVDTDIFKFGTRMYVPGYGVGKARDTGGFIHGHHIDLAMYSCKEALKWGAKPITIAYETP